jgi:hypothetical protein
MPSFEQVHLASEWILTVLIPLALWWFNRMRKAEATRTTEIATDVAKGQTAEVKKALDEHADEDRASFARQGEQSQKVITKLEDLEDERRRQHLENQVKLTKLETNSDTLMGVLRDWQRGALTSPRSKTRARKK